MVTESSGTAGPRRRASKGNPGEILLGLAILGGLGTVTVAVLRAGDAVPGMLEVIGFLGALGAVAAGLEYLLSHRAVQLLLAAALAVGGVVAGALAPDSLGPLTVLGPIAGVICLAFAILSRRRPPKEPPCPRETAEGAVDLAGSAGDLDL